MPDGVGVAGRPPTARQRLVYRLLLDSLRLRQRFPTWRELMRAVGARSPNAVLCHVRRLERAGLLARDGGHFVLPGVRVEVAFEDSEAGRRARAAWEGGA